MSDNNSNQITLKFKYSTDEQSKSRILEYIKNYNNLYHIIYNRFYENNNLTTKEIYKIYHKLNNIFVDTWFLDSLVSDIKRLIKINKENKIIFGGKKLFEKRKEGKISKEEFQLKRLISLYSMGKQQSTANPKFRIITENHVIFQPTVHEKFYLKINPNKNYQKYILQLIELQNQKKIPISYKLDTEYVYVSFDLHKLKSERIISEKIKDRYFAIDMNPNYIGYSIVEWLNELEYKIIDKGAFSLKKLNDYDNLLKGKGFASDSKERKYITNKRNFEVINIAHKLVKIAEHYRCESFVMEDLIIKSKDNKKGSRINKLCNQQWCRNVFVNQIKKICKLNDVKILEVVPNYTSFIGNLVYRKENLPDFVLASIEISRRGYEFNHQYILKDKEIKKNIVHGNFDENRLIYTQSLEEMGVNIEFSSFQELYDKIKKSKLKYRFPLEQSNVVFRKTSNKSFQTHYKFA